MFMVGDHSLPQTLLKRMINTSIKDGFYKNFNADQACQWISKQENKNRKPDC